MGLGIGVVLARQSGGLSFLKSTPNAQAIAREFCERALRFRPLGRLARFHELDDGAAEVRILPIEENVEFTQSGPTVVVSARTSSVGPGYHAYVVSLLDEVIAANRLSASETDEWLDETGYFQRRDFTDLQQQMEDHFRALSNAVVEHAAKNEGAGTLALSMPVDGFPIDVKAFAATPRGPRDRAFFDGGGSASEFFSWWDQGLTRDSSAGLAEALLWTEYPWRQPHTDEEETVDEAIAELLAKGATGETALRAAFDTARKATAAPLASGLGYKRGSFRRPFAGDWTIVVPGYFIQEFADGMTSFWFDDRGVHASSFTVTQTGNVNPDPFSKDDMTIDRTVDGLRYRARVDPYEEDDQKGFRLWGGAIDKDGFATVSIVFVDEGDRGWAEGVLFSLNRQ